MDEFKTARALSTLDYNPRWLESGLLDQALLEKQLIEYDQGNDRNTEHYRYAAFRRLLDAPPDFVDDELIDRYIELANLDADRGMAQAALGLLANSVRLTEQQLVRLEEDPAFDVPILQKIIKRSQLLRELDSASISNDLFDRCISQGDAQLEQKLLAKSGLSQQQVETLMLRGSNRAVRNVARNLLLKWMPR
jgi:hypothetical protein